MRLIRRFPILLALAVFGCQPAADKPADSTTGAPAPSTTAAQTGQGTTAALSSKNVPDALKTEAWEYFGCGNENVMNVELRVKGRPTMTGGVSMKLESVDKDKATYTIERTGAIADSLGNETVEVNATGIFTTANTTANISPARNLTLPTDLSVGKTWPSQTKVAKSDGTELQEDSVFKVVGVQDVVTKVGKQTALLVTSAGTANVKIGGESKKAKYDTKSWYVKGKGPVKLEITLAMAGQPVSTVVVEETK